MYYVIYNTGRETLVEQVDEETLKKRLSEEYYGPVVFKSEIGSEYTDIDTQYWDDSILIIKGDIVVPQAVQTVTEYKL
jgi:hypothetical protein